MVLSSEASTNHIYVIDDVIRKSRSELVDNGELEESVLCQIQSIWKTKMIQAGLISASIETSSTTTLHTLDPNPLPENAQFLRSNPSMDFVMPIKRERNGSYIPQQDGARDEVTKPNTCDLNDENDDELLNEDDDDDDDEEDAIDDDMDIPHLVMCQFDKVKRSKNKWECSLKSGVMQINGKNILFSKATGVFNF